MRKFIFYLTGVSIIILSSCDDVVTVNNASNGQQIGLLTDGNTSSGFNNDKTLSGTGAAFSVGKMTPGGTGELIAFSNLRPVAVKTPINWTDNDDAITMNFSNKILLPVTVWIVQGPFNTARTNAINMCITTSSIWDTERMGAAFSLFEIIDATSNANANNFLDFDCSMKNSIETYIGKTAGRINIYVVRTVDGGAGRGQACQIGSDFVAISSTAGRELLSHELGHDFSLQHVDGQASFDQTNIMHSASNSRQFITEGQLVRAHLRNNSALNFLYNSRAGQPNRDCGHNQSDNQCPSLNKRIWADGTFPAN